MEKNNLNWALLSRYVCNEATELEKLEVLEWILQDPTNEEILAQIRKSYDNINFKTEEFSYTNGLSILAEKLKQSEPDENIAPTLEKERFKSKKYYSIVACVILLLSVSIFLLNTINPGEIAILEKSTTGGQKSTIVLSDGSTIRLNSNSSLRYPEKFKTDSREVYLEGEAFFEIVKNPKKPFIVKTYHLTTRVLGTSFNIKALPDDETQTVTVATGKVSVEGNHIAQAETILLPNEQARLDIKKKTFDFTTGEFKEAFAWKDGKIIFSDASLIEVISTLESWYGVPITLEANGKNNCNLTAEYDQETLINVLESMSHINNIEYSISEKGIFIISNDCK